jgi:hypothetical protein
MNSERLLREICEISGCSTEQVRTIVGLGLRALHKVAVCHEWNVTGAMMECYWAFGEEACYHFGGILEEARRQGRADSWSETYARFAPGSWDKFRPVLEGWQGERSEARRLLDDQDADGA